MKVYSFFILFNLVSFNYALPIFSSTTTTTITASRITTTLTTPFTSSSSLESPSIAISTQNIIESTNVMDQNKCPESEYAIPVERFAQLVSTHWQFDHLESIKSGTYKIISEQFQEHIQISIEPTKESTALPLINNQRQKSFNTISGSSWDMMMDLEILHAQIFGAIQAHTEGSLHIAWDRLSDKLGQPAFGQFIRNIALNYCTLDKEQGLLSSTCLKEKASTLSLELDEYINLNLNAVFTALENDILPNLLSNTSKDLSDVLAYFNRLFLLKDNQHLYLQVAPWSTEQSDLKLKLLPLLNKSVLNDDHLTDFFESYACLSRA